MRVADKGEERMPIIQSLDRALRILDLFDELNPELKITEISQKLDLNKSTAHSLLKTLKHYDYIRQNPETGKYSLGLKLLERSTFLASSMDVRTIAKRMLTELSSKTGCTTHLVVLDGKSGVYIDKVESPANTIVYSRIGRRVPVHSSAVGKALLAYQPEEEIKKILNNYQFSRQTDKTITSKKEFLAELKQVAADGYAMDREENEPGVNCYAVPLYDHTGDVRYAISLSAPLSWFTEENRSGIVRNLKETAATISEQIGYRPTYQPI